MIEFEDDFELPIEQPVKPVMEPLIANEQAFYTSDLNEDSTLHEGVRHDLETTGFNPLHEFSQQEWREEQDAMDRNIILDVISDPAIPLADKKAMVKRHDDVNNKSTNLRDKYIQRKASVTDVPVNVEDLRPRQPDIEAQDLWIETIQDRKIAHDRLQATKLEIAKGLNPSAGSVIGGMLLDFLPFAFPNFRSLAAAEEAGLELDAFASDEEYKESLNNLTTSFLATGSVNQKIADAFQAAPPEQQEVILQDILRGLEKVPGTDFNKFIALQEIIEAPIDDPALVQGRNLLSILEAHPLGQLITNPIRTIKWYTTFAGKTAQAPTGPAATAAGLTPEEAVAAFRTQDVDPNVPPTKTQDGTTVFKADTALPNYNILIPTPKREKGVGRVKPESAQPNTEATITLGDKAIKEKFPSLSDDIQTDFSQTSTGTGRGNITDDMPAAPTRDTETPSTVQVTEDFVEGQNFGQQKAARELTQLAKGIPTAKDGKVFIDDLWKAAGGADAVPLKEFKQIIKDMHDKGSIKLVSSGQELSGTKKQAATLIGRNDEELDSLDFGTVTPKTIDEALDDVDEFGDDIASGKLMDKVLNKAFKTPEQKIKEATDHVYMQSFADKQAGMSLVRVPTALFDEAYAKATDYIGAGGVGGNRKKYDGFTKFFNETKNIEVGSVKVDAQGNVTFTDGRHRYAVLRDKGLSEVPLSMDTQSVLNARKHGLLGDIMESPAKPKVNREITRISRAVSPSIEPNSPAGTLAMANPVTASNTALQALEDVSGEIAKRMGASRAQYFGDWVLPKQEKALEEQFPGVAHMLRMLDKKAEESFVDAGLDVNIIPVRTLQRETDLIVDTMRDIKGATYQQSNSTFHFGKGSARGIAQYGRNDNYGWNSAEDANRAFDYVQRQFPNFPTRIVQKNNQFFVEQEWEHNFNSLESFFFGVDSLKASFLGADVSAVARSRVGPWVIPSTMSDNTPGLKRVGGAFLNELKQNRIETEFNVAIQKEILNSDVPLGLLNRELNLVQEGQRWASVGELKTRNAHLSKSKMEGLVRSYEATKRLAEYHYNWVNRLDRTQAERGNFKGLYTPEGQLVGLGKTDFPSSDLDKVKSIWSYEKDRGISKPAKLEGQTVVFLRTPVKDNAGHVYNYAIIGGKYEMGILPSRTLPRVEGWIARKNVENWYVDVTPRSSMVDGRNVNGATIEGEELLRGMRKTVAAGMTEAEAKVMIAKLSKEPEFQNDTFSFRKSDENEGNATINDYTQFARSVKNARKRGERLPTPNGDAALEDNIQALASSMRSAVRVQVNADYIDEYQKAFVKAFGKYTKGQYPTHISQIEAKPVMSTEELKELKVAQRKFEWLSDLQQFSTFGDEVWANFFQGIADRLEKFSPVVGSGTRTIARQGNIPVRAAKSLATVLFIHTNPLRQWMVQPQQLMELNLIEPSYLAQSATDIPAIITALYSKAPHTGELELPLYNSARALSGMSNEEFDEVFDALYKTGLPQAVDMNSMLLGMLHETRINIDPTLAEDVANKFGKVVRAPGIIGKNMGFTPAELANNIGTWLFTRQRWIKNNPEQNWNTPENLATITKQAWDISHSMIGRAGALPYQKGTLGTIMQFQAVQHKGFLQTPMSKTLNTPEKVKISAARLALYGAHGIPMLAVVGDAAVEQFGDTELKEQWANHRDGFIDAGVNTLADIYMLTSGKSTKNATDIRIAKTLSPIPETIPFWDLAVETFRIMRGEGGGNPRLPFVQALGSMAESYNDVADHFRVQEMDTTDKLIAFGQEVAQLSSGYNNWAKAKMISDFRDKKNKKGQFLGLELTEAHMVAQLFGAISQQELDQFLIKDEQKQRQEFVTQASRDIYDSMVKLKDKVGQGDWKENQRRVSVLTTALSSDPALINEIIEGVYALDKGTLKRGTVQDTLIHSIYQNKSQLKDEHAKKMIDILRTGAPSNEGTRKVLELLESEGII